MRAAEGIFDRGGMPLLVEMKLIRQLHSSLYGLAIAGDGMNQILHYLTQESGLGSPQARFLGGPPNYTSGLKLQPQGESQDMGFILGVHVSQWRLLNC